MSQTSTAPVATGSSAPGGPRRGERARRLPNWAPGACFVTAAAVVGALWPVLDLNVALFVLYTVVLGTLAVYLLSRSLEGPRRATDRLVTCLVVSAFGLAMVPLVSLVWEVVSRGAARLDGEFFNSSLVGIVGEGGGAYHAIMGTLFITALTTLISVPIGLMTAIFLGPGIRLGVMGAIALSVLMIPVVVRSAEEVLKLVPNELREASYALGVPKWRTIVKVVIPTSIAGLGTGVTLAIARVVGETAPLLITLGITNATNLNAFDGRMATLPVYAYYQLTQPGVPPQFATDRAWTAALVLIILVMGLNVVARLISRFFAPKTGR